jgi:DNA-binding MarR family transcriptional regulator
VRAVGLRSDPRVHTRREDIDDDLAAAWFRLRKRLPYGCGAERVDDSCVHDDLLWFVLRMNLVRNTNIVNYARIMPRDISDDDDLIDALGQTAFMTMGALTGLAADAGLSLTQLRVLAILRDRRLRMSDLAEYLGLEKSTMTGLVARAERKELLARVPNEQDARAVDVVLTDQGRDIADALSIALRDTLTPLTAQLPPGDRGALTALLRRMLP